MADGEHNPASLASAYANLAKMNEAKGPTPEERKRQAQEAINTFLLASGGDSNDAEIAAGRDCMELLAAYAGVEVKVIPDEVDKDLAAKAAEDIATLLGSAEDWDQATDFLVSISGILFEAGFRNPNNDENRTYYESISE